MTYKDMAQEILSKLELPEKLRLLAGADMWHTEATESVGLPSVMMTDGPHGLRKQRDNDDGIGLGESVPATCFPAACATACSFDRELMYAEGRAIGEECRGENVAIVLGPGANIKRSPLGGRNFEYFSEDPYLSGEMAAAYINGVQEQGVGVSLKHFALNNQEKNRCVSESVCDERAQREIYLAAFERAVKKAQPYTVMCSYNKLDGFYAAENKRLLSDILRKEWGFTGAVVSDWGAVSDRTAAVKAGLDLQMPGPDRYSEKLMNDALQRGELTSTEIDACALRVIELVLKTQHNTEVKYSKYAHDKLARALAAQCAVLLKNENGLLPGSIKQNAAVIGAMAKTPRYQGSGSSRVNPTRLDNAFDELGYLGLKFEYAAGYAVESDEPDETLIAAACEIARGKDIVYIFAGLPDRYESEGFDRSDLFLPRSQTALIERISRVNDHVAVILSGGGVIDMSWEASAQAVLMCYLSGQAGGGAAADLLLGLKNPGGKLAESWPLKLEDNPSYAYFPGYDKSVEYRESIFVGYRYYDTAEKPVRYPFGYGLSYTQFAYSDMVLSEKRILESRTADVAFTVKNIGSAAGSEIVQLYVKAPAGMIFRPEHELKGFEKVTLQPGEEKRLHITVEPRSFAFYNDAVGAWHTNEGLYEIQLAASSRDIRLRAELYVVAGDKPLPDRREALACYYDLSGGINVGDEAFTALYGRTLPPRERAPKSPYTLDSTLNDVRGSLLGRFIGGIIAKKAAQATAGDDNSRKMIEAGINEMPIRFIAMGGGNITRATAAGLVELINAHPLRALKLLLGKYGK